MEQTPTHWKDSICISVDNEDELSSLNCIEDMLFEMFKDEKENKVHVGSFLSALVDVGLRRNDIRLQQLNQNLIDVHQDSKTPSCVSVTTLNLDNKLLLRVIRDNLVLISKALRQKLVIPEWDNFCRQIQSFYAECKSIEGGKVADYIPQLSKYDPDLFGVSVCTTDGQRYSIGDANIPFSIQSCSKPITYSIALNELGSEIVHNYVGQEPSGRMFNAIVLDYNSKPHNPLVNAGSIIINSLIFSLVNPKMTSSEKFDFVQDYFKRMAGHEHVGFSNGTFMSERENADRNYALAYYMRENKCFPDKCDMKQALDLYFQCCSLEVTAESASMIAATLANGGICPTTDEKVLEPNSVRDVLSLMHSCGMYDYSGQFAFKIGLPAKSGVCGAIILVVPNVMGVCCWSPPLDSLGNSVRGIHFCQKFVEVFNFHRYDNLRHASNKMDPRKQKYDTKSKKVVSVFFSAAAGDVSSLRRAALSGIDLGEKDYDGRTALHLAAAEGHLDAVKFLITKCKVDPTTKDRWGRRPLDDAEYSGNEKVIKIIKDAMESFKNAKEKTETIDEEREA